MWKIQVRIHLPDPSSLRTIWPSQLFVLVPSGLASPDIPKLDISWVFPGFSTEIPTSQEPSQSLANRDRKKVFLLTLF